MNELAIVEDGLNFSGVQVGDVISFEQRFLTQSGIRSILDLGLALNEQSQKHGFGWRLEYNPASNRYEITITEAAA